MNLGKALSQPAQAEQPVSKQFNSMIGRDETTGKTYLKIPLPDAEVMNNIFSGLGELIINMAQKTWPE